MKFTVALAALAGVAAAAPQQLRQRSPHEHSARRNRTNQRIGPAFTKADGVRAQTSSNWAGAVQNAQGVTRVVGTITVPTPRGTASQSGAAWVGIDGDVCQGALLQTGIDFYGDGSFDAWWEWIPDEVVMFDNFPLRVGDKIYMEVDASSTKTGVAILQNLTTGKKVSHTFTKTPSTLCETDAEWIVEDFAGNLAGFSEIVFTNNSATTSSGTITPAGGTVINLAKEGSGRLETDCGIDGSNVYCNIDLEITKQTSSIELNAEELKIISSELHDENGDSSRVLHSTGCSYHDENTSVTISFDEELPVANVYKLVITYQGALNAQSMGFYRAQYKALSEPPDSVARDKDGSPYIVCTQFQPVGARRAFPCFDEPNMKATFSLDIELPADQTAISNTPVATTEDVADGRKRVSFETTPVMSTYLLAWAVGDLKYIETFTAQEYGGSKVPVRFYATAGLEGQGSFAIEEAAKAIDFFSKTFGIDYPLAKMDLLAIPEFSYGAMENWGLITGKANLMIFDENTSASTKKELISSIVSHEVAHQWFGNLVTMDWWDELWLNEGFATWAGNYAVDHFHPDWDTWEKFMSEGMEGALIRDAMRSSHPIQVEVPDARNVHEVFDQISYQKSCAVLNMLANHMGVETFLSGVSSYLRQNKHRNATAEDLWQSLGEVSGDDIVTNIKPWIEKIGHPVLTITKEADRVTLRQSRFLAVDDMKPEEDETVWWIPLGFRSLSGKEAPSIISALSEKQTSVTIPEDQLYLLNSSGTGFYRLEYPKDHLAKLSEKLDELSAVEKLTILNSASALAFSGSGSTVSLLGFMQAFAEETNPQVWLRMMRDFSRLRYRFNNDAELLPGIKALTRAVIGKMVQDLGWEQDEGESHLRSELRRTILDAGFHCESPEVVDEARRKNMMFMRLYIDPSLRYLLWAAGAQASPNEAVPALIDQWHETASSEVRGRLARAVCLVQDPDVIRRHVLPFCYGTTPADRVLKPTDMRPPVTALALQWPARQLQWEYVKAHWDAVVAKMGTPEAVNRVLNACLSACTDAAEAEDIDRFFADKNTNGYAMTLAKVKDGILNASRFRERERAPLAAWLREQGYMTPQ
ncbi:aminopeptidase 2 [Cordyceps javanica]|uniref:Aminopeptidase 2 n=1 Tax=Cordyceps javanica TaxID=43265 RepID=A0A545WA81_9HYPO|nr:aminopeptidase 2 [Cordyceps javanica]TQW10785.1 aminopeptidase 2 [Cordyceps javanica]